MHIGETGIGLEKCSPIIHSDTIFNAIINAYSLMHTENETNEFLSGFENVRFTSAFPFWSNELLFPRPRIRVIAGEKVLSDRSKKIKKAEFVSKKFFEKIINGELFSEEEIEELVKEKRFYKEYPIPKVYLDRETKKSDFFIISTIKFEENCGLWFSIECENGIYKDILSCLRLLQDEGFGGKRTLGYGLFEFEQDNINLRLPNTPDLYVLLSLFYPKENEKALFGGKSASWDFVLRGGYRQMERKPRIRLIKEGSVFENLPNGKILKFDKFVHYGLAYTVPAVGGKENG
jgi:CRISPR-associated protein Csm4